MRPLLQAEVYTGELLGRVIDGVGVNRLAVLVEDRTDYLVRASALLSSFLTRSTGVGELFFPEELEPLLSFDPHLTVFLLSSDHLPSVLEILQREGISTDVLLPPELRGAVDDHPFWRERDVFEYDFDLENGKLILYRLQTAGWIPLFEYNLVHDHVRLLR